MQLLPSSMTTTEAQHRINCGWYVVDDDLPNVPNCDPLASAQARIDMRDAPRGVLARWKQWMN
jgi:hypothetical protein